MDIALVLARFVHVVGIAIWLGGATVLAALSAGADGALASRVRAIAMRTVSPAMIAAWIGGLILLIVGWQGLYSKAPWMHTKLLVGFIGAGLTGVFTARLRKVASGQPAPSAAFAWLFALVLLLGAGLVFLRPGA